MCRRRIGDADEGGAVSVLESIVLIGKCDDLRELAGLEDEGGEPH